MSNTIKASKQDVMPLIMGSFPDYKGRKYNVRPTEEVMIYDLNWHGGTRSEYRIVDLTGRSVSNFDHYNAMHPWDNKAEGERLPLPAGFVIVRHSIFCGKDTGLTFYINPADMPKILPASSN